MIQNMPAKNHKIPAIIENAVTCSGKSRLKGKVAIPLSEQITEMVMMAGFNIGTFLITPAPDKQKMAVATNSSDTKVVSKAARQGADLESSMRASGAICTR